MERIIRAGVLLVVFVGIVHSAFAQQSTPIARLSTQPRIDGTLNESVWRSATFFTDFKTLHPEPGKEPSARTGVYLGYDSANIYVGINCLDQDSSQVRAESTDPENISADDWAAFCLDSHGDAIGSFYFVVTPRGTRRAGVLNYDGDPTATRELNWRSAAQRKAHGYTLTMAIPLAQLPFASGDSVRMAFKVARFVSIRNEEDDCPEIKTDRAHVLQFRTILLSGIVRSATVGDGFVGDLWNAYRAKVNKSANYDYNTLNGRVRGWHGASILDYLVFPSRPLHASRTPFRYPQDLGAASVISRFERLQFLPGRFVGDADRFLTRTQTQSFIVIRNDTVLYEKYFNGYTRDSIVTSFSTTKSFVSTLVGVAIDRGLIQSVADPVSKYLPELAQRDSRFERITLRDLLRMSSGLRYVEDGPPHDNDITYLDPNLLQAALDSTSIVDNPGVHWLYNNYNPLLIGMILNRVTCNNITQLLQQWLWDPLGMEFGGSWSIDSKEGGFEKMESGINARAIDYAKLGSAFLHHGSWRGNQIVSRTWVEEATQPRRDPIGFYGDEEFFGTGGHYYGYFWWGSRRTGGESDFYAVGNKGQYIYCSPQKHLVIVRSGMEFGIPSGTWVRLFRGFADQF